MSNRSQKKQSRNGGRGKDRPSDSRPHQNQHQTEKYIPSPYNFVPLSDKVFFPGEPADGLIDHPFSDGISGTLQVRLTAQTPIYIRNGGEHTKDYKNTTDYSDFFRVTPDGPYAIPGTSIKGMLRNVVEIASFGKIIGNAKTPRVDDHRYAVRDLHNAQLYTNRIVNKQQAAWLDASGKNWTLTLCDFTRVEQEVLEHRFNLQNNELGREGSSCSRYQYISPLTKIHFNNEQGKAVNLSLHKEPGKTEGTIVLTGQPSPRGRKGSKHLDFIFFNEQTATISLDYKFIRDFEFIHTELGENRKANKEWEFWGDSSRRSRIPVFVLLDNNNQPKSMGFAMMFRLPYKHSIHETIKHTSPKHAEDPLDLAEQMFGRVNDKDGLRGRVSIETWVTGSQIRTEAEIRNDQVKTILSAPKASYYPNYVKQQIGTEMGLVKSTYKTYMDDDAEIRGWKRYIVRKEREENLPQPVLNNNGETNVGTTFSPLPKGTQFTGTIHVHNLRPYELGALLWAITWDGDNDLCHSIGMGKPYGFGSVTLEIIGLDDGQSSLRWVNPKRNNPINTGECIQEFKKKMDKKIPGWESTPQIVALKTIANPRTDWPQSVRYPDLERKEFVGHKNQHHALISPSSSFVPAKKDSPAPVKTAKEKLLDDINLATPQNMNIYVNHMLAMEIPVDKKEVAQAILKRCEISKFRDAHKKAAKNPTHWLNKVRAIAEGKP